MRNVIERAREVLGEVTPLATDCGQVCGGRCCHATADSIGMLLFPGEEALAQRDGFRTHSAQGGCLMTCDGVCDRDTRPLACRMFPLFPLVTAEGRIRAVYDPRGWRLCPLVSQCAHVPLRRDFVRAVRRAGRILMEDSACAAFLRLQSEEICELNRLVGLEEERPPIARRKP